MSMGLESVDECYKDNLRLLVTRVAAPRSVLVLFHGGGWVAGDPHQFDFQRQALAAAGIASASVEYRVKQRHGSMVADSVADALDAGAYVRRAFADVPLFCCGASSGGLLAIHCALASSASGVILFNPVVDLSAETGLKSKAVPPGGAIDLSPLHMDFSAFPTTLIMHGDNDNVVPLAASRQFAEKVRATGAAATVVSYPSAVHGFFNLEPARTKTCNEMQSFILNCLTRGSTP